MEQYSTKSNAAFLCTPTIHFQDFKQLETIIHRLKMFRLKPPTGVIVAIGILKGGENFEETMNSACDGILNFYLAVKLKCAKEVGAVTAGEARSLGDGECRLGSV